MSKDSENPHQSNLIVTQRGVFILMPISALISVILVLHSASVYNLHFDRVEACRAGMSGSYEDGVRWRERVFGNSTDAGHNMADVRDWTYRYALRYLRDGAAIFTLTSNFGPIGEGSAVSIDSAPCGPDLYHDMAAISGLLRMVLYYSALLLVAMSFWAVPLELSERDRGGSALWGRTKETGASPDPESNGSNTTTGGAAGNPANSKLSDAKLEFDRSTDLVRYKKRFLAPYLKIVFFMTLSGALCWWLVSRRISARVLSCISYCGGAFGLMFFHDNWQRVLYNRKHGMTPPCSFPARIRWSMDFHLCVVAPLLFVAGIINGQWWDLELGTVYDVVLVNSLVLATALTILWIRTTTGRGGPRSSCANVTNTKSNKTVTSNFNLARVLPQDPENHSGDRSEAESLETATPPRDSPNTPPSPKAVYTKSGRLSVFQPAPTASSNPPNLSLLFFVSFSAPATAYSISSGVLQIPTTSNALKLLAIFACGGLLLSLCYFSMLVVTGGNGADCSWCYLVLLPIQCYLSGIGAYLAFQTDPLSLEFACVLGAAAICELYRDTWFWWHLGWLVSRNGVFSQKNRLEIALYNLQNGRVEVLSGVQFLLIVLCEKLVADSGVFEFVIPGQISAARIFTYDVDSYPSLETLNALNDFPVEVLDGEAGPKLTAVHRSAEAGPKLTAVHRSASGSGRDAIPMSNAKFWTHIMGLCIFLLVEEMQRRVADVFTKRITQTLCEDEESHSTSLSDTSTTSKSLSARIQGSIVGKALAAPGKFLIDRATNQANSAITKSAKLVDISKEEDEMFEAMFRAHYQRIPLYIYGIVLHTTIGALFNMGWSIRQVKGA